MWSASLKWVRVFHWLQWELVEALCISDISVKCGFINCVDANYCEGLVYFHVVHQHEYESKKYMRMPN